jgi:HK97 family phage portal protein
VVTLDLGAHHDPVPMADRYLHRMCGSTVALHLVRGQCASNLPTCPLRLCGAEVRIATAPDGAVLGYVYNPQQGLAIPYDNDEIVHLRYPNPNDDYHGMGTVEAIASVADRAVAQNGHITGFFQNGARISGILTIPETLSETQFERLKATYAESFAGPANAYKMLVAEGVGDYKPIQQTPIASGVIDLTNIGKDETLAAFGIPAPLVGGLMENANYEMEESQHIFLRAMIPRTRRIAERFTVELTNLWQAFFAIDAHANEPMEIRIAHAKATLEGGGASVNEAREMRGQPPSDDPMADKILVPNNMLPLELVGAPPRPRTALGGPESA